MAKAVQDPPRIKLALSEMAVLFSGVDVKSSLAVNIGRVSLGAPEELALLAHICRIVRRLLACMNATHLSTGGGGTFAFL